MGDEEDEDFGELEFDDELPAFPFSWRATASAVGGYAAIVLRATANLASEVATQLAADHNYRIDQRNFHEQAALEIEKMTQGE